jgi:hypothetical protein
MEISQPQNLVGPVAHVVVSSAWAQLLLIDSSERKDSNGKEEGK